MIFETNTMATSFTVRFNADGAVITFGNGREQYRTPQLRPDRACDGCLKSHAVAWHSFYHDGLPYFKRETGTFENVAICSACNTRAHATDNDDEEAVEKNLSSALQPANRRRYESSDKWQAIRSQVLTRDEGLCRLCLSSPAAAIHHLSYANYGNELLYELIAVCHKCHQDWHVNKDAYNRERWQAIMGKRKCRFPALKRDTWRLSSHAAAALGAKRKDAIGSTSSELPPDALLIKEDIWYCECQTIACFPHDGKAKRQMVAKGCKQCGDFHKFGYFKRKPKCEAVGIDKRILEFTNARLDAFARNRFAEFYWHPKIQEAIEASWPCKCSRTRKVFRLCRDGIKHYGRQCVRCGIFHDAEVTKSQLPARSRAHDPNIALRFRRNQYLHHLDRLVDIEIEKLRIYKHSEAMKWLESGVLRMQLDLARVRRAPCFRCDASGAQNIWFRVMPRCDYFSCLELAPFCDACYSLSVSEFVDKWNPVPIPLLLHDNNFCAVQEPEQAMLF